MYWVQGGYLDYHGPTYKGAQTSSKVAHALGTLCLTHTLTLSTIRQNDTTSAKKGEEDTGSEGGVGWRDGCSSSRVRGGAGEQVDLLGVLHREEGVLEITYPNLKHHIYQACTSITIHVCPLLGRPDQPSARLPHVGHVGPASPRLRYTGYTVGTAQQLPGCLLTAY